MKNVSRAIFFGGLLLRSIVAVFHQHNEGFKHDFQHEIGQKSYIQTILGHTSVSRAILFGGLIRLWFRIA